VSTLIAAGDLAVEQPGRYRGPTGRWRLTASRWASWSAVGLACVLTLVALLAPLLAPNSPIQPTGAPYQPVGSSGHLFGTDNIGRDIFSRVILGVRTSWLIALVVVAVGLLIGGAVGVVAGALGGWVDSVLMRITDMFLALPAMLVAVAVAAAMGHGLFNTFVAITVVWRPYYARIVRGEIRSLAARPHVEAARMAGAGRLRIMLRHLLPGIYPTALVTASLDVGAVVTTLASLSFIGLGQSAPAPELGADTSRGMPELLAHWWIPVMPGLAVLVLSLVANLTGDAVRNLPQDGSRTMTTHLTGPHPLARFVPRLPRTSLARFLLVRLTALIGLLLVLSLVLFVLQEISGAAPVAAAMQHASPGAVAAKRHDLGLDDPAPSRYLHYVWNLIHLDFGTSFRTSNPVRRDIWTYLPPTVELVLFALVVALMLALLFAVSSVLRWPGGLIYRTGLCLASASPAFLLGILGLIVFYQDLGWFPASGRVSNPDAIPGEWH
jgi:peptide/nickel transport system permease protein